MKEVRSEIAINASAQHVWQILTDFPSLPQWNPFIRSAEGELREGERLKVRLSGMRFSPRVLRVNPNRELRWLGNFLFPGLFDGEHYFIIEPLEEGHVRFVQGERFRGVLVPFLWVLLGKNITTGFGLMNRALKARAETAPGG